MKRCGSGVFAQKYRSKDHVINKVKKERMDG